MKYGKSVAAAAVVTRRAVVTATKRLQIQSSSTGESKFDYCCTMHTDKMRDLSGILDNFVCEFHCHNHTVATTAG